MITPSSKHPVILSVGGGRLHFCETLLAAKSAGVHAKLVLGWVPTERQCFIARALGRFFGRSDIDVRLSARLMRGLIDRESLISEPLAEFAIGIGYRYDSFGGPFGRHALAAGWRMFGRVSRKHFSGARCVHIRAGAGQGGAIAAARRMGLRVIVDQSLSHPCDMDRTLGPAYKRAGHSWKPLARDPFWTLVARDCAEADCVLVNSQGVRDSIVRHGVNPQRIRVLYLGVRLDFLGAKTDFRRSGKLNLLFTGSFIVRKGLLDLLELMDRLRNSNVDAVLNVVGDAEEAKKLLGNRLNREDLILHGFQPQESLGKFLAEADMYVFPTLAEGCAKSAMEALAAGLPVVTTPSCGLPGLPGRDWVSVPENQPDELCRAVLSLAGNEALRTQIGKAGTALVREGYSWEQYGRNLAALYNELDSGIFDSLERSHLPAGLM